MECEVVSSFLNVHLQNHNYTVTTHSGYCAYNGGNNPARSSEIRRLSFRLQAPLRFHIFQSTSSIISSRAWETPGLSKISPPIAVGPDFRVPVTRILLTVRLILVITGGDLESIIAIVDGDILPGDVRDYPITMLCSTRIDFDPRGLG